MGKKVIPDGASRGDLYAIDPEKFTIIGGRPFTHHASDTNDVESHPLWDPRCVGLTRLLIDKNMVKNVAVYGVREPVIVRNENGRLVVIDGRHRVVWARIANERLEKEGQPTLKVPYILNKVDDMTAAGLGLSLNYVRVNDSPVQTAKNIARRRAQHASDAQMEAEFALGMQMIKRYESLLDLHPDILKRIDSGELTMSAGIELGALDRDEQTAAIERIQANGSEKPKIREVKAEVKRVRSGDTNGKAAEPRLARPSLGDMRALRKHVENDSACLEDISSVQLLRWIIGEVNYRQVGGLAAVLRKAGVVE